MNANVSLERNPNVVFTQLDPSSSVLLNVETKEYFSLNGTGGRVWNLLEDRLDPESVVERMAQEYAGDRERIALCTLEFLTDLQEEGLIRAVRS